MYLCVVILENLIKKVYQNIQSNLILILYSLELNSQ